MVESEEQEEIRRAEDPASVVEVQFLELLLLPVEAAVGGLELLELALRVVGEAGQRERGRPERLLQTQWVERQHRQQLLLKAVRGRRGY